MISLTQIPLYIIFACHILSVMVQPLGCRDCVTDLPGQTTYFGEVSQYGTTGILAHDFLAGSYFYELESGDIIKLQFDGKAEFYKITRVVIFTHVVDQESVYSWAYKGGGLTLQTCYGDDGFLFIKAHKIDISKLKAKTTPEKIREPKN